MESPSTVVTTDEDVVDSDDGVISLREAVSYAGTGGLGTTISFSLPDRGDSVQVHNTIAITRNLTFNCFDAVSGEQISIYGNASTPLFEIAAGATVTFNNGAISSWSPNSDFGGSFHNFGNLTLVETRLVFNAAKRGGGVFNEESGVVSMDKCVLAHNYSAGPGVLIYNLGTVSCESCSFVDNEDKYDYFDGEPVGESVSNHGEFIARNCFFSGARTDWTSFGFLSGGMIVNDGKAVVDGAGFFGLSPCERGSAIANGTNAVLQVNNASFYLVPMPAVSTERGGKVLLANSSFSNDFWFWGDVPDGILPGCWELGDPPDFGPCVQINGTPGDMRVYNCAFDMIQSEAFRVSLAEMRGCAFHTANLTRLFSTVRARPMGDTGAYSLLPVSGLASQANGIPLRSNAGILEYSSGGTWTSTGLHIPDIPASSLQKDMFGDARSSNEGSTCFPGATVKVNGPEAISTYVTTAEDVVNPNDGLISIREAIAYAPYFSDMNGEYRCYTVDLPSDLEKITVKNGPIVFDARGCNWKLASDGGSVELSGNGVSRIVECRRRAVYEFENIRFADVSVEGNGGAVLLSSDGRLVFIGCEFENCVASGSGGAVYVPQEGDLVICAAIAVDYTPTSFTECQAGVNGGAIACEGNALIDGAVFTGCTVDGLGGAVYFANGVMRECAFHDNTANEGGALWTAGGSFYCLLFADNNAVERGGAVAGTPELMDVVCFNGNVAPEGAAVYLFGSRRKLFTNVSFFNNRCTDEAASVVVAADGGTLRVGNCDEWKNIFLQDGNFAASVDGTEISFFNSVLPDQLDDGSISRDATTHIALTNNLASVLICNEDGSPLLYRYCYQQTGEVGSGNQLLTFTSLVTVTNAVSAGVGIFTAEDGDLDLAYFDRDNAVWRNIAGEEVAVAVEEVGFDMLGQPRGASDDADPAVYGLGSVADPIEVKSLIVTTTADVVDGSDLYISLREAMEYARALGENGFWNGRAERGITFDIAGSTNRTVVLTDGFSFANTIFPEDDPLVVDGACSDGTLVTVNANGLPQFFNADGTDNSFVFRNLVIRNSTVPNETLDSGAMLIPGKATFENCSFDTFRSLNSYAIAGNGDKTFRDCVFNVCEGGIVRTTGRLAMEDCVIEGSQAHGRSLIFADSLQAHKVTIRDVVATNTPSLITLGAKLGLNGPVTNTVLTFSVADTAWSGDSGSVFSFLGAGVTDFGNVSCGGNDYSAFLTLGNGMRARILNSVIEGSCEGASIEGTFRNWCGPKMASTAPDSRHAAVTPPSDANPGTPVGAYLRDGVRRLAIRLNGSWHGVDDEAVASRYVTMESTDLFGVSRLQGGKTYPWYTCGALTDYAPEFVVTTADDVVNATGGKTSFRQVLMMFKAGQRRMNGECALMFSIPEVRDPVIRVKSTYTVDSDTYSADHPLTIYGANGKGKVTFDGQCLRSIFNVQSGSGLELHDCVLMGGNGQYGGAVNAEEAVLGLDGVTISNSYASVMGGAVWSGDVWARNCTFADCVTDNGGGAIGIDAYGSFLAENCAFYDNTAYGAGGAVYGKAGVDFVIKRATFAGNYSYEGAAVFTGDSSRLSMTNSVVCENMLDYEDSAIIYGDVSDLSLDSVTTWNNAMFNTSASAAIAGCWEGRVTLTRSLVGEPDPQCIDDVSETVFDLNDSTSYFVVSNGMPYAGQAYVDGVWHLYRRPTDSALCQTGLIKEKDLFGVVRTTGTLGALDLNSEPPVYVELEDEEYVEEITNPALQDGVDPDAVDEWVEAFGIDIEELNESDYALNSYLLNTPLQTADPVLTITAIEQGTVAGTWLVTVHAVATFSEGEMVVPLGEQNAAAAAPLINGKLTVSAADSPEGPWTIQTYDLANLTFTPEGDAVITADAGDAEKKFFKAVITK